MGNLPVGVRIKQKINITKQASKQAGRTSTTLDRDFDIPSYPVASRNLTREIYHPVSMNGTRRLEITHSGQQDMPESS